MPELKSAVLQNWTSQYLLSFLTAWSLEILLHFLSFMLICNLPCPLFVAKPISLVERCWCRSTLNTVPQRSIKELKFLHTPNCPFQVIAKLKSNREVCINPETKWLQQYLKNAINKVKKSRRRANKIN
uniref:Stromal cell-derived factor 1 n=1 Tax=Neolamprologus brichardi TaxID=32507 RepID=A0A3Q4G4U1_NEOBR